MAAGNKRCRWQAGGMHGRKSVRRAKVWHARKPCCCQAGCHAIGLFYMPHATTSHGATHPAPWERGGRRVGGGEEKREGR